MAGGGTGGLAGALLAGLTRGVGLPVITVGSEGVSGVTPGSVPILTLSSSRSVANSRQGQPAASAAVEGAGMPLAVEELAGANLKLTLLDGGS